MNRIRLAIVAGALFMTRVTAVEVVQVDIHERLYPDRWPTAAEPVAISIPRGAPVTFQFAVRANKEGLARLAVDCKVPGKTRIHWLKSVHVEGNTQGSLINRPGGKVPEGWLEHHLVRAAPFDTLEAVIEGDRMPIVAGQTHGVVVELSVPRDTEPGTYKGALCVTLGDDVAVAPFAVRVHRTLLPDPLPLHSIHWLWAEPVNLTTGEIPEWWSKRHWQLLEQAGKQLLRFGDDTVFTPLTHHDRGELIQITRRKDGTFAFDYSRFDRWCELFLGLGFRTISGRHIVNMGAETYVTDEATGRKEKLLSDPKSKEEWLAFLPTFYDSFHAHLKERGWIKNYIQCQYDEPRDEKLYRKLAELARQHMPGIPTCDAINNRADRFSPLVDTQVFSLLQLNKFQRLAAQRKAKDQGVWLYHCTSPYPPNPNRHIDSYLTESRLYPWLAYKLGANGFLFWAANGYRGADEYKSSIGPFPPPKNNQDPGHPPGDNWFYYRTPEGLQPSLRIFSHREGLVDHALLTTLAERDPTMVKKLIAKIAPSITRFERDPAAYHRVRTAILDALDKR